MSTEGGGTLSPSPTLISLQCVPSVGYRTWFHEGGGPVFLLTKYDELYSIHHYTCLIFVRLPPLTDWSSGAPWCQCLSQSSQVHRQHQTEQVTTKLVSGKQEGLGVGKIKSFLSGYRSMFDSFKEGCNEDKNKHYHLTLEIKKFSRIRKIYHLKSVFKPFINFKPINLGVGT